MKGELELNRNGVLLRTMLSSFIILHVVRKYREKKEGCHLRFSPLADIGLTWPQARDHELGPQGQQYNQEDGQHHSS